VTSATRDLPRQYRIRAQEARDKALSAGNDVERQRLLQEADIWERMAAYEEQNPTFDPSYYPKSQD